MGFTVLFGGTFNPFHIGHYQMLNALCGRNDIDEVFVMPDRIPPHKECDFLADDIDRINMCSLAAEDFDKASVCTVEFELQGKSYTYNTVLELKKRYPEKRFAMACGADMIATLDKWYRWEELLKEISFFAFNRSSDTEFKNQVCRMRKLGADITVVDSDITHVSSTMLRKTIRADKFSGLMPKKIAEYIFEKGLYV
ncbi:MAG: nicotinate (nicotinamide) nucleotide adenylyltransferase [Ruminococcaceae bacterium]|nr:nicotinate (nicotinamide) nucleotide adenylyltransferase [Oscillospiraceae bacterium]